MNKFGLTWEITWRVVVWGMVGGAVLGAHYGWDAGVTLFAKEVVWGRPWCYTGLTVRAEARA